MFISETVPRNNNHCNAEDLEIQPAIDSSSKIH